MGIDPRGAAEFPLLNIFSLRSVERYLFEWRLTEKGLITLEMMQQLAARAAR